MVLTVFMVFWEAVYYKVFGIDGYWDGTIDAIEGMLFRTVDWDGIGFMPVGCSEITFRYCFDWVLSS